MALSNRCACNFFLLAIAEASNGLNCLMAPWTVNRLVRYKAQQAPQSSLPVAFKLQEDDMKDDISIYDMIITVCLAFAVTVAAGYLYRDLFEWWVE